MSDFGLNISVHNPNLNNTDDIAKELLDKFSLNVCINNIFAKGEKIGINRDTTRNMFNDEIYKIYETKKGKKHINGGSLRSRRRITRTTSNDTLVHTRKKNHDDELRHDIQNLTREMLKERKERAELMKIVREMYTNNKTEVKNGSKIWKMTLGGIWYFIKSIIKILFHVIGILSLFYGISAGHSIPMLIVGIVLIYKYCDKAGIGTSISAPLLLCIGGLGLLIMAVGKNEHVQKIYAYVYDLITEYVISDTSIKDVRDAIIDLFSVTINAIWEFLTKIFVMMFEYVPIIGAPVRWKDGFNPEIIWEDNEATGEKGWWVYYYYGGMKDEMEWARVALNNILTGINGWTDYFANMGNMGSESVKEAGKKAGAAFTASVKSANEWISWAGRGAQGLLNAGNGIMNEQKEKNLAIEGPKGQVIGGPQVINTTNTPQYSGWGKPPGMGGGSKEIKQDIINKYKETHYACKMALLYLNMALADIKTPGKIHDALMKGIKLINDLLNILTLRITDKGPNTNDLYLSFHELYAEAMTGLNHLDILFDEDLFNPKNLLNSQKNPTQWKTKFNKYISNKIFDKGFRIPLKGVGVTKSIISLKEPFRLLGSRKFKGTKRVVKRKIRKVRSNKGKKRGPYGKRNRIRKNHNITRKNKK